MKFLENFPQKKHCDCCNVFSKSSDQAFGCI